jgi:hypothetical protein
VFGIHAFADFVPTNTTRQRHVMPWSALRSRTASAPVEEFARVILGQFSYSAGGTPSFMRPEYTQPGSSWLRLAEHRHAQKMVRQSIPSGCCCLAEHSR